jgi:large subunit ribosomal protein L34
MGTYTTFHPHKIKKRRTHGFLERMSSPGGRAVIKRRRKKGRKRLAV